MIFPGHIAASVLCHRYARVDLRVALVAGITPDVVDKLLHYLLRITPSSRVPMHTLLAWVISTVLVALVAWLTRTAPVRDWAVAWFLGYGVHLFCDSPLLGGELPFFYPFRYMTLAAPRCPFPFSLDSTPGPYRCWWPSSCLPCSPCTLNERT